MCYGLYISTDSEEDLAKRNSRLVRFRKVVDADENPCLQLLESPNKWYVGSESECSCTFRHLAPESSDLSFSEPEDWYKEEQIELDATRELYLVLDSLLANGHWVDLVDTWEGSEGPTAPKQVKTIDVSFDGITEKSFRLIEGYKFRLTKAGTPRL